MRAICFEEKGRVGLRDIAEPRIAQPTDAIVQVETAGLCGSDLHVFHGRETGLDAGTVMGHEFVGRIVALGAAVRQFAVGDRVVAPFSTNCGLCFYCLQGLTSRCAHGQLFGWVQNGLGLQGAQAERVRVPWADTTLLRLPQELSDAAAILLGDNLSTGFYCADLAEVGPDQTCAVVGCGTVGLLAVQASLQMGARVVFAIDQVDYRLDQAERLGAQPLRIHEALAAVREATDGRGADAVLEVVGLPEAQRLAYDLLRPGGRMGVVGCHCSPSFAFGPVQAYDKNLTYRTGRCPARRYMNELLPRLVAGETSVDWTVTHTFRFEQCAEAYDVFAHRQEKCLKVLFRG